MTQNQRYRLVFTTGANSEINQSEFLTITCNLLKAREKSGVQGAIGFGGVSHWLNNWQEIFKPINKRVINFDSHLKSPLRPQTIPVIITQEGRKNGHRNQLKEEVSRGHWIILCPPHFECK